MPNKVQVNDIGVDGRNFPAGAKRQDDVNAKMGLSSANMFAGDWFTLQVNQVDKVRRPVSSDAESQAAAFWGRTKRKITLITVQEFLDEQHVQKM